MEAISAISLISSCASLAKTCISVSKTLTDLAEKYKQAELTLHSLSAECETIELAWSRIECWASKNMDSIDDFDELLTRLAKSIHIGKLVMTELEKDLQNLHRPGNLLWRTRLVWNETVMRDHQHRLRGQVGALVLLLEAIQLPSRSDHIELLSLKEAVFDAADESVRAIIPSQFSCASSIRMSMDSYVSTELRYKPLAFDNDLFTSFVYKRNFRIPGMRNRRFTERAESKLRPSSANASDQLTTLESGPPAGYGQAIMLPSSLARKYYISLDQPLHALLGIQDHTAVVGKGEILGSNLPLIDVNPSRGESITEFSAFLDEWYGHSHESFVFQTELYNLGDDPTTGSQCIFELGIPPHFFRTSSFRRVDWMFIFSIKLGMPAGNISGWRYLTKGANIIYILWSPASSNRRSCSNFLRFVYEHNCRSATVLMQYMAYLLGSERMEKLVQQLAELDEQLALSLSNDSQKIRDAAELRDRVVRYRMSASVLQLACASGESEVAKYVLQVGAPLDDGHSLDVARSLPQTGNPPRPPPSQEIWETHPFLLATLSRCGDILRHMLTTHEKCITMNMRYFALRQVLGHEVKAWKGWEKLISESPDRDLDVISVLLPYCFSEDSHIRQEFMIEDAPLLHHILFLADPRSSYDLDLIKLVVRHIGDLDKKVSYRGERSTCLFMAVLKSNYDAVQLLVEAGATECMHESREKLSELTTMQKTWIENSLGRPIDDGGRVVHFYVESSWDRRYWGWRKPTK